MRVGFMRTHVGLNEGKAIATRLGRGSDCALFFVHGRQCDAPTGIGRGPGAAGCALHCSCHATASNLWIVAVASTGSHSRSPM